MTAIIIFSISFVFTANHAVSTMAENLHQEKYHSVEVEQEVQICTTHIEQDDNLIEF